MRRSTSASANKELFQVATPPSVFEGLHEGCEFNEGAACLNIDKTSGGYGLCAKCFICYRNTVLELFIPALGPHHRINRSYTILLKDELTRDDTSYVWSVKAHFLLLKLHSLRFKTTLFDTVVHLMYFHPVTISLFSVIVCIPLSSYLTDNSVSVCSYKLIVLLSFEAATGNGVLDTAAAVSWRCVEIYRLCVQRLTCLLKCLAALKIYTTLRASAVILTNKPLGAGGSVSRIYNHHLLPW